MVGSMLAEDAEEKALMAELLGRGHPHAIGRLEADGGAALEPLGVHDEGCGCSTCAAARQLAAFLDHAVTEEFLRAQHRAVLTVAEEPGDLLDALAAFRPPGVAKWTELEG